MNWLNDCFKEIPELLHSESSTRSFLSSESLGQSSSRVLIFDATEDCMLGFKLATSLLRTLSTFSFCKFRSSTLKTDSLGSVIAGSGRLLDEGFGGSRSGVAVGCAEELELNGNATLLFKFIFRFPVLFTFFGGSFQPGVNPKKKITLRPFWTL